jgi:outer membrane protein
MGVEPSLSTELAPLSEMQMPSQSLEQIMTMARAQNPLLESNRARAEQSGYQLTSARRAYFPSFSLSAGISGYTNRYADTDLLIEQGRAAVPGRIASCISSQEVRAAVGLPNNLAECNNITFTPAQEAALRESQSRYPFGFTRNPYSVSASLSLPLFDRFNRESNIQNAQVARRNADNNVRQQELRVSADVSTAWLTLTTSQQTVALQEQNARTARSALSLAQQRYQVGSITLVELVQARNNFDRAETDRITAVYDFQRAFVQLEAAVGRPLR